MRRLSAVSVKRFIRRPSLFLSIPLSVFVSDQPISWFTLSMCDSNNVNMVWLDRIDDRTR